MKIYFAGPLFSLAEKYYNEEITAIFEKNGHTVFLPQRDGYEYAALKNKNSAEKSKMIFDKDISEIRASDLFFMILDGRVPDDGACVELGYAYALGKPCYGLKTDTRGLMTDCELNPLIEKCFLEIFTIDFSARKAAASLLKELKLSIEKFCKIIKI